jgi:hypothetical protein
MTEDDKIIPQRGLFKGKEIRLASRNGVNMFFEVAEDFMKKIFNFEPGEYLITDESSLFDFTGLDDMEITDLQKKIQDIYGIDVSDIESGNLLKIFMRIYHHKFGTPSS